MTDGRSPGGASRPVVLLVEDDAVTRFALKTVLTEEGYAVAEAADGEAAMRWLDDGRPDLVVLDLVMPVVSGWAFLEAYGARMDGQPAPPVLVISSIRLGSDYPATLGVQGYLGKPFDLDEFVEQVAALREEQGVPAPSLSRP